MLYHNLLEIVAPRLSSPATLPQPGRKPPTTGLATLDKPSVSRIQTK